jgi:hypothetical protein
MNAPPKPGTLRPTPPLAARRAGDHAGRGLLMALLSGRAANTSLPVCERRRVVAHGRTRLGRAGIPTAALDRPSAVVGHVGQGLGYVPAGRGLVAAADRRDSAWLRRFTTSLKVAGARA